MQSLTYIAIALAGLAVAAMAYFGFTFTPIEAFVSGLCFVAIAMSFLERTLRHRAEARLERAIGDLSRLLSTDAQAGAVLGQRINALIEENAARRIDAVEADVSVLGTVVRQVAEAVADLEQARHLPARPPTALRPAPARRTPPIEAPLIEPPAAPERPAAPAAAFGASVGPPVPAAVSAPVAEVLPPEPAREAPSALPMDPPAIALDDVRQALDDNRLVFHVQPIVTLPQRRTFGYDLVPRLLWEHGAFADPPDFWPRRGGEAVIRRIERQALEETVTIARRARTAGQPALLFAPLSRATLVDATVIDKVVALLEANRAVASQIGLSIAEADWSLMPLSEKAALAAFVSRGVQLSLTGCRSLRLDFAGLAGDGVRSVRVDAAAFLAEPGAFTDFHPADVVDFVKRFGIDLILTGIEEEEQVLLLLEDGFGLAQGGHIARPGPPRADLVGSLARMGTDA